VVAAVATGVAVAGAVAVAAAATIPRAGRGQEVGQEAPGAANGGHASSASL
jgi:hypothetical protein